VGLLYALAVLCLLTGVPALLRGEVGPPFFLLATPLILTAARLSRSWPGNDQPDRD
jgi:hypothetical protein